MSAQAPRTGIGRRALELLRPYRRRVLLLLLLILASAALGITNPLLTKVVFDQGVFPPGGEPRLGLLTLVTVIMAAIVVVTALITVAQTYVTSAVGQRVMHDLRERLYAHLQRMSLRFFTSTRTGEIQARITHDIAGVGNAASEAAAGVVANTLFVLASIVTMAVLSWQLTVLSLVVLPLFVYLTYRVGGVRRRLAESRQETIAELTVITEETLSVSGMLLMKIFGRERDALGRYGEESRRLAELGVRQQMAGRAMLGLAQSFFLFAPALVYLGAGYLIAGSAADLTPGTVIAFTWLQGRLFYPVTELMENAIEVQTSLVLFERIFEYLDEPNEIVDAPHARELDRTRMRGGVAFRDVTFRYQSEVTPRDGAAVRRPWALEDISFAIEPGQLAAIVGPSGAGKTTITYLIARLYDVDRGGVEIDGIDVREIRLSSLMALVGMVAQETVLFHTSVLENLLYARPDATQGAVEQAARAALIHERILELEHGYDTVVGERGYRMSGGEKQRLAIARVILKDPRILILDEATSALDTMSERLVQSALAPLLAERTTIAIAHRLSTVLAADVIFVLDGGRLCERGTHADLLARGGMYARLYQQQFEGGRLEARCEDGVVLASGDVVPLEPEPA